MALCPFQFWELSVERIVKGWSLRDFLGEEIEEGGWEIWFVEY